jgi:1-pyrroline-5-carboxylate dehydrogenase
MLSRVPKNLIPKFRSTSKTPLRVKEIIDDILESPLRIPRYLNFDTPFLDTQRQISAFSNKYHVAEYQPVDKPSLTRYFNNYTDAKKDWENTSFDERKDIFLKAADLISDKYYNTMLAYTMVGQNKNIYEAEIDAVCELVDFLRFNVAYAEYIHEKQPIQVCDTNNISEYNSLNGFVAAITPFNFTAIGGNLASAPLLFGNSVLWKPSPSAILSNHLFYEIMIEAGLPRGVLNFCPMDSREFLDSVVERPDLGAVLFTGSSDVFDQINKRVYKDIEKRVTYPRIIGETGGKNFHFVDESSKSVLNDVAQKTIESAFNYSGQKCSACSVMYVPENILDETIDELKKITNYFNNNMENYGVISKTSYEKTMNLLKTFDHQIDVIEDIGNSDKESYYISPKILVCRNHDHRVFHEEFFAPILSIYPYNPDKKYEVMKMCVEGNNYALTGSIFSLDDKVVMGAMNTFRNKTGNFYVNDKSTGSIVGQQPFGGNGKSGTNDKVGDINFLYRLFNQRNIKINYSF